MEDQKKLNPVDGTGNDVFFSKPFDTCVPVFYYTLCNFRHTTLFFQGKQKHKTQQDLKNHKNETKRRKIESTRLERKKNLKQTPRRRREFFRFKGR